jgi:plasmid stabilization system protein ParE
MQVFFTYPARADLRNIEDYIARDNPAAASAVIVRLAGQPHMGRRLSGSRRRRFPVTPYPYLIYYEVAGDTVRVLRIRHAARYRAAFQEPARAFAL